MEKVRLHIPYNLRSMKNCKSLNAHFKLGRDKLNSRRLTRTNKDFSQPISPLCEGLVELVKPDCSTSQLTVPLNHLERQKTEASYQSSAVTQDSPVVYPLSEDIMETLFRGL